MRCASTHHDPNGPRCERERGHGGWHAADGKRWPGRVLSIPALVPTSEAVAYEEHAMFPGRPCMVRFLTETGTTVEVRLDEDNLGRLSRNLRAHG